MPEVTAWTKPWESSHLLDYVPDGVTYADLVRLFGEPHHDGDGYKVDAEWTLSVDGRLATIYNYKTGVNYDPEDGIPVEEMTGDYWHIGGNDEAVAQALIEYITENVNDA